MCYAPRGCQAAMARVTRGREATLAHIDHLKTLCGLRGMAVADVGAGDGLYSRDLAQAGARVTAIEVDPGKVRKAKDNLMPNIDVRLGRAEELPLSAKSQGLVCFFFALHHVPVDAQDAALSEVRRVLAPGGRLHVVEPYPHGTMFDVVRMVEDETFVRTNAHRVLSGLDGDGAFQLVDKRDYVLTREYPTFTAFVDKIVKPDPDRSAVFARVSQAMEETYDTVIEDNDGARVLHQPCAAYHFAVSG